MEPNYRVRTSLVGFGQLRAVSLSREEGALVLVRIRIFVVARYYLYRATPELLPCTFLAAGTREGRKKQYLMLVHVRAQPFDIRFHDVGRPVVLASLRQGVPSWWGVRAPSTTFLSPLPYSFFFLSLLNVLTSTRVHQK